MNCKDFRNQILQYLENDISQEEKNEMKSHMEQCEECKRIYKEEKEIDELVRTSLNDDCIYFNSSVNKVISMIDKDKYIKDKAIYLNKKIDANRGKCYKYLATVASLFIVAVVGGGIYFFNNNLVHRIEDKSEVAKLSLENELLERKATSIDYENSIGHNKKEDNNYEGYSRSLKSKRITPLKIETESSNIVLETKADEIIRFTKQEAVKIDEELKTPWKSISTSKEACITDKGKEAMEEGLSNIAIKNINNKKIELYRMDSQKYTPKFLEPLDEKNILVIVGYAHGTVARGGDVYILDITTGEAKPVYINHESRREQVVDVTNKESELVLTIIKFDENMSNYNSYKGVIEKKNGEIANTLKIYDAGEEIEEIIIK